MNTNTTSADLRSTDAYLEARAAMLREAEREMEQARQDDLIAAVGETWKEDKFQALLAFCAKNVLHHHACEGCGGFFTCRATPCSFRPFDKNERGEYYQCEACQEYAARNAEIARRLP